MDVYPPSTIRPLFLKTLSIFNVYSTHINFLVEGTSVQTLNPNPVFQTGSPVYTVLYITAFSFLSNWFFVQHRFTSRRWIIVF